MPIVRPLLKYGRLKRCGKKLHFVTEKIICNQNFNVAPKFKKKTENIRHKFCIMEANFSINILTQAEI